MRGTIAAACAAVLVGLAPPGALACASLGASAYAPIPAAAQANRALAGARPTARLQRAAPCKSAEQRKASRSSRKIAGRPAPAIWRDPSGPPPSRGPPASSLDA
jgi:hypothetical protein